MIAEKVISAQNTGTAAGTTTPATVREVDGVLIERLEEFRVRLNVTQALIGDTPTLDIYLQRAVAGNPAAATDAHWEDFYHFPQVTTSLADRIANFPLPAPQDVDASLASYSRARAIETLAADTALGGHPCGPIRIRAVLATGGVISQAGIYDIEIVGR